MRVHEGSPLPDNDMDADLQKPKEGDATMQEIRRGEVYYIPENPLSVGREQKGSRPGVIVSNNKGNRHADIVTVVLLTEKPKPELPTHAKVPSVSKYSVALCEQVVTVDKLRLERYLCTVTAEEMQDINMALRAAVGI